MPPFCRGPCDVANGARSRMRHHKPPFATLRTAVCDVGIGRLQCRIQPLAMSQTAVYDVAYCSVGGAIRRCRLSVEAPAVAALKVLIFVENGWLAGWFGNLGGL